MAAIGALTTRMCMGSHEGACRTIERVLGLGDRIVPCHFKEMVKKGGTYVWDEPCELRLLLRKRFP